MTESIDPHAGAADLKRADRGVLLARIRSLESRVRQLEAGQPAPASLDGGAAAVHFRELADTAPAMLWVTDEAGLCTFLSQGWYAFTGQTEADGMGLGWLDAVHPDDRDAAREGFLDAMRRRERFSLDHRLRRADGEYRWVIDAGRPRYDAGGRWSGYIGSVIDVHERNVAMQALRQSEARYRMLFDSIDEGFCVLEMHFDADGRPADYRFLETNPAFVEQTGLTDAIGRRARELLPDLEEHWFELYGSVARTGEPIRFESGSEVMGRWFDVYAFRVESPAQRRVALLFTDVSEQRRAAAERERLLRETEAANRTKAEFLATMSHELRTPLNAIGGYTDLLQMGVYGALEPEQRTAVERVAVNQRHLLVLINDVLSFARLEAGRLELDLRPLSAAGILRSIEPLVSPQAEARGIAYGVDPCSAELYCLGDAERVRQILLNLAGNAIKFTPPGGRVVLSCSADAKSVRLAVRDTGVGIALDEQERVFDPFQQVGRRLNQPLEGVGLGLAISRDLARAMHGDILLRSAAGEGSTFTLRLPRAAAP
jgi:PAS domain S-box-containing protein